MRPHARQVFLFVACSATAATSFGLEPGEVFDRVAPSVWQVRARTPKGVSQGSGVVIAPERVVTNCHVIAGGREVVVKRDNVTLSASVEYRDPARDLCQLRVPNLTAAPVPIAPLDTVKVGAKVFTVGNPLGLENTLSDGLVSALRRGSSGGGIEKIQTTAPITHGSSGGGLFDAQARLVGITTAGYEHGNLNFAIPAAWIAELATRDGTRHVSSDVTRDTTVNATPDAATTAPKPAGAPGTRTGDAYEYVLTDLMTKQQRTVAYRVDRLEGDHISFNDGSRVEWLDGTVASVHRSVAGEFDLSMPPGGWRPPTEPFPIRKLSYVSKVDGVNARYNVERQYLGHRTVRVPAGEFSVQVHRYEGWVIRTLASATYPQRGSFQATVWYSEELKRPVRFEVESKNQGKQFYSVHERVELARLPGT